MQKMVDDDSCREVFNMVQNHEEDKHAPEGGRIVTEIGRDYRDGITAEHRHSTIDIDQFQTGISIQLDVST